MDGGSGGGGATPNAPERKLQGPLERDSRGRRGMLQESGGLPTAGPSPGTVRKKRRPSRGSAVLGRRKLFKATNPYTSLKSVRINRVNNYRWFATNFESLDELLGGGINTGEVLEIVGEPSVGKTQLCMMVATRFVANIPDNVLYIDTCNSCSPVRLYDIFKSSSVKSKGVKTAFKQLRISCVSNIFALNSLLKDVQSLIENRAPFYKKLRLLIVDSLSQLAGLLLSGESYKGQALLAETCRMIKYLANKFQLAVIVRAFFERFTPLRKGNTNQTTNHTVSADLPPGFKPALGESWTYFADRRLALYFNPEKRSERIMALLKSPDSVHYPTDA